MKAGSNYFVYSGPYTYLFHPIDNIILWVTFTKRSSKDNDNRKLAREICKGRLEQSVFAEMDFTEMYFLIDDYLSNVNSNRKIDDFKGWLDFDGKELERMFIKCYYPVTRRFDIEMIPLREYILHRTIKDASEHYAFC